MEMVLIRSSSSDKIYTVTPTSCTCPNYVFRQRKTGGMCKHMIKVFYNKDNKSLGFNRESFINFFRGGVRASDVYESYIDSDVQKWISMGEICYNRSDDKYYLLE